MDLLAKHLCSPKILLPINIVLARFSVPQNPCISSKNFGVLSQNFCVSLRNFVLAKCLHLPENLCICLQNVCVVSQSFCSLLKNFAFTKNVVMEII